MMSRLLYAKPIEHFICLCTYSIKWLVAWLVVVVVINHTNTDSIVFDNLSEVIVYCSSTSRIKVMPKIQA